MTLTHHALMRLNKRNIPYHLIQNCLYNGKVMQTKNAYKITNELITIITDIKKQIIITIYPISKINKKIKKIAKREQINFSQAAKIFFSQMA